MHEENKYKIALIQMKCVFLDIDHNLDSAEQKIREAAKKAAKIICLPEAFNTGYNVNQIDRICEFVDEEAHRTLEKIRALAKELEVMILSPVLMRESDGKIYNMAILIDDTGSVIGKYAKTHLISAEKGRIQRGIRYPVWDTKYGRIGCLICYDLCFPETARLLALKDAQIVLVPSAWRGNYYYTDWWDLNVACRALDNLFYVAAVNQSGDCGADFFAGKSKVCSPVGKVLSSACLGEETVYAEIDPGQIIRERSFNTVLDDRLPKDYLEITR